MAILKEIPADITEITYDKLFIPSFELLHIIELQIIQKINEHAKLEFKAIISEEVQENILSGVSQGYPVKVFYQKEDKEESKEALLFYGAAVEIKVDKVNGLLELSVAALSATNQLDWRMESHSYQDVEMTYKELADQVLARTSHAETKIVEGGQKKINEFTMQYQETDWEFLKRMASRLNTSLIVDMNTTFPKFYIGLNEMDFCYQLEEPGFYHVKKIMENSRSRIGADSIRLGNLTCYQLKTSAVFKIGDKVKVFGGVYIVKEAIYQMEGSVLKGIYSLCRKEGFYCQKTYNEKIRGLSLAGVVRGVKRDKVQIHLEIDEEDNSHHYFPYATVSASPDGSGWYFMPEPGDELRLYFPDKEEKNAYTVCSISSYLPKKGEKDRMEDPETKYIRTVQNQEIRLTAEGVEINSNNGMAVIQIGRDGDIHINGRGIISITAEEEVEIRAGTNLMLLGGRSVELKGKKGSIVLDEAGDTIITGMYVDEN